MNYFDIKCRELIDSMADSYETGGQSGHDAVTIIKELRRAGYDEELFEFLNSMMLTLCGTVFGAFGYGALAVTLDQMADMLEVVGG